MDIPAGGKPRAAVGPDGMQDVVLPPWTVPVYRADGSISEIQVTRRIDILRYLVLGNARPISFSS